jgi:plastocyanin/uncharacterized membrane protein YozB (DUF420 family)
MSISFALDAPALANANLVAQMLMGAALLVGMLLARRKRFRAHAACQSAVVLLNLLPIATFMVPVFTRGVAPRLFEKFGDPFYAVSATHALLGLGAELLGLYIIVSAGTDLLPARLRLSSYKTWMRAELGLWWLVILLGVATYFVWYGERRPDPETFELVEATTTAPARASNPSGPAPVAIMVGNFSFEPKEITIAEGTTVIWKNVAGRHTAIADDKNFESPVMATGDEFRHTFSRAGNFAYHCSLHGARGGQDMAGLVKVITAK